eukprot:jgi/Psemu1/309330/fgenesh1_kg.500_\
MNASIHFVLALLLAILSSSAGFHSPATIAVRDSIGYSAFQQPSRPVATTGSSSLEMVFGRGKKRNNDEEEFIPGKKMNKARRKKLGVNDDEEEYDLEMALDNSTDPLITKIIAGSLILSIIALLVFGLVIPATTDYGEGVCNPLLTGG